MQVCPQLLSAPPQRPVQSQLPPELPPLLLPPLLSLEVPPLELVDAPLLPPLLEPPVVPPLLLPLEVAPPDVPPLLLPEEVVSAPPLLVLPAPLLLPPVEPDLDAPLEEPPLLAWLLVPLLLLDCAVVPLLDAWLVLVPVLPLAEAPELVAGASPDEKQVFPLHCWPTGQSASVEQLKTPEGRLCRQPASRKAASAAAVWNRVTAPAQGQSWPLVQVVPPQQLFMPSVPQGTPLPKQPQSPQLPWHWLASDVVVESAGQQMFPRQQSAVVVQA